jgi:hypothetical protein
VAKLIEYDVSGVEDSGGGGVQPKQGVYPAEIVVCEQRDTRADGSPANDIHIALKLGADYAWVHSYIGLSDSSDWKLKEFINAVGLKDKGKMDPEKLKGKIIKVKINPDSYEGEYRARAGRLMKAAKGDKILPAGATTEEEEPEEAEEEAAEETTEESSDFSPSRESDPDVGSYDDWDDADLESEVEDRGVTVPGGRGKKRDKWIAALRSDDEEGGEEAEEEEATASEDDYDEWDVDMLTSEVEERDLEMPDKPKGKNAAERFKAKIIELLRADDSDNPF